MQNERNKLMDAVHSQRTRLYKTQKLIMRRTNYAGDGACNNVAEKRSDSSMRTRQVYGLNAQHLVLATEIAVYAKQLRRNRNCGVVIQTTNFSRGSEYLEQL